MITLLHPAEDAATQPRPAPLGPVTEGHRDDRQRPDNVTSRRRDVSSSKRISTRTETNHSGELIGAGNRATVARMLGSHTPLAEPVKVPVNAREAEHYRHGLKPKRHYLLIGDANELPMLPHAGGRLTRTRTAQPLTYQRSPRRAGY
jgi:hypothetical protein